MSNVMQIVNDLRKHSVHLHGQDATGEWCFAEECSRHQLFTLIGITP